MSERPYLSLILPAYNEAGTIAATISKTAEYFRQRRYSYEIIVAADGNDGTRELIAGLAQTNPSIRVIGETSRCGKGHGVRKAVEIAAGKMIGYADADYKVPIEEFDKIVPYLDEGCEVVIGSRALEQSRIERAQPLYRQIGSRGFRIFMRAVVGLHGISDSQCGFKFFQAERAKEIFRRQKIDGYMFDVEILALAQFLGYRIQEVPVRWRDDGDSRLQLLRGNMRNVLDIFRIRFSRQRNIRQPSHCRAPKEAANEESV